MDNEILMFVLMLLILVITLFGLAWSSNNQQKWVGLVGLTACAIGCSGLGFLNFLDEFPRVSSLVDSRLRLFEVMMLVGIILALAVGLRLVGIGVKNEAGRSMWYNTWQRRRLNTKSSRYVPTLVIPHASHFKLYHIVSRQFDIHYSTHRSTYHYTEHNCNISPKSDTISRSKGATNVYCQTCGKDIEVITVDNTFAKFPKETLTADNKLRLTILWILWKNNNKVFFLIFLGLCGIFWAPVVFSNLYSNSLFVFSPLIFYFIIALTMIIVLTIKIRNGVIIRLGSIKASLVNKIISKSPVELHRVVTNIKIDNMFSHELSYRNQEFKSRSISLSWNAGEEMFGNISHCYIDNPYNESVPTAGSG